MTTCTFVFLCLLFILLRLLMTFRIMTVVSAATQQSMVFSWAVAKRRNDTKYFVLFRTHCFGVYLGISLCTGFCFWQYIFVSLRISYGEEDLWLAGTGEHTGISSICHSESQQRASFGKGSLLLGIPRVGRFWVSLHSLDGDNG